MSYSDPIYETYRWLANASLSTAATVGYIQGPTGKTGRVVNVSAVITTATTVAASAVTVGVSGDLDSIISVNVPVKSANTAVAASKSELSGSSLMAADTVYIVSGDGGATAGAADITVTVAWF